jgi:hypothetical protein
MRRFGAVVTVGFGVVAASLLFVLGASAAPVNVCASGSPYTTIPEALAAAPGGSTVTICPGTYAGGFTISKNVTLLGAGASQTTISGGGPVLTIASGVAATISGVTINGGRNVDPTPVSSPPPPPPTGGGIVNAGALTLIDSNVSGNEAVGDPNADNPGGLGGGIYTTGTVILQGSSVTGNSAGNDGGGIYSDNGPVTLEDSSVSQNSTRLSEGGAGGGVFIQFATLTVDGSTISGNSTGSSGGGIWCGTLIMTDSTISDNVAVSSHSFGSNGGGIFGGDITVSNSTISGNVTAEEGGGIDAGALTITDSHVSGNGTEAEDGEGGGLYVENLNATNTVISNNTAWYRGGGGIEVSGTSTLTNATITDNSGGLLVTGTGGGGILNTGDLSMYGGSVSGNTTNGNGGGIDNLGQLLLSGTNVSGNSTINGAGADGAGHGGGIYNTGPVTLTNSTVTSNTAASGGGIYNLTGTVTLYGTSSVINNTPDNCFNCVAAPADTIAPTTTIALNPSTPNGSNGWYTEPVGVTVSASDNPGGSGVEETLCEIQPASAPAPASLSDLPSTPCPYLGTGAPVSSDGEYTIYAASEDNAGNVETMESTSFKIDQTPPTVTYSGHAATYGLLATVAINCTASDNLSGVASTTCANVSLPAWTFGEGLHTFSASATDDAGNVGTGSTSFTVTANSVDLGILTGQFVDDSANYLALKPVGRTVVNALVKLGCSFLTSIGPKLAPAKTQAFINGYEHAVQALVGPGWLTQAQATTLKGLAGAL